MKAQKILRTLNKNLAYAGTYQWNRDLLEREFPHEQHSNTQAKNFLIDCISGAIDQTVARQLLSKHEKVLARFLDGTVGLEQVLLELLRIIKEKSGYEPATAARYGQEIIERYYPEAQSSDDENLRRIRSLLVCYTDGRLDYKPLRRFFAGRISYRELYGEISSNALEQQSEQPTGTKSTYTRRGFLKLVGKSAAAGAYVASNPTKAIAGFFSDEKVDTLRSHIRDQRLLECFDNCANTYPEQTRECANKVSNYQRYFAPPGFNIQHFLMTLLCNDGSSCNEPLQIKERMERFSRNIDLLAKYRVTLGHIRDCKALDRKVVYDRVSENICKLLKDAKKHGVFVFCDRWLDYFEGEYPGQMKNLIESSELRLLVTKRAVAGNASISNIKALYKNNTKILEQAIQLLDKSHPQEDTPLDLTNLSIFLSICTSKEVTEWWLHYMKEWNAEPLYNAEFKTIISVVRHRLSNNRAFPSDIKAISSMMKNLESKGYRTNRAVDIFNLIVNSERIRDKNLIPLTLQCHITFFDRFDDDGLELLKEQLQKKEKKEDAVIVVGKSDYSGALLREKCDLTPWHQFLRNNRCNLTVYECENIDELYQSIRNHCTEDNQEIRRRIRYLVLAGHGDHDSMILGFTPTGNPATAKKKRFRMQEYDKNYLDVNDSHLKQLKEFLSEDPYIIFFSCLVGQKEDPDRKTHEQYLVRHVARNIRNATVIGPDRSMSKMFINFNPEEKDSELVVSYNNPRKDVETTRLDMKDKQ